MLESGDKIEIKKKWVEIKTFLKDKIADFTHVAIEDQSQGYYRQGQEIY